MLISGGPELANFTVLSRANYLVPIQDSVSKEMKVANNNDALRLREQLRY